MWYLLIVVMLNNQALTSQQFPVGSKTECIEKMKVFDNSELNFQVPGRIVNSPFVRAICIEGK